MARIDPDRRLVELTDGRGQLTVATQTGSVKLSARGKTVEVEAGTTVTRVPD